QLPLSLPCDGAHRIANGPAIVRRTYTHVLEKNPGEDLVRRIPDLQGDLGDGKVRHLEELTGFLDPQSREVDTWWHTQALLEHAGKVEGRQLRLGRQLVEAYVLRKPSLHQLETAPLRPGGKTALCRRERRSAQAAQFGKDFAAGCLRQQSRR